MTFMVNALSDCLKFYWKNSKPPLKKNSSYQQLSDALHLQEGSKIIMRNGEYVSYTVLKTTLLMLEKLKKEEDYSSLANILYKKAIHPWSNFSNRNEFLRHLHFLNSQNQMYHDVACVVRNCFEEVIDGLNENNPITGKKLRKDQRWQELADDLGCA